MSDPDSALENLNLDEMPPATRSTTRSTGAGRGSGQSHRMDPLTRPTQGVTSAYAAGSSRRPSQPAQALRQQTHYRGDFKVLNVNSCSLTIDFTLIPALIPPPGERLLPATYPVQATAPNEQACVSIDKLMTLRRYRASCDFGGHASDPTCVHILWLIGRLFIVPFKIEPTTPQNVNQQVGHLYDRMRNISDNDILQCIYNEDRNGYVETPLPSVRAEEQQVKRDNLCDILSSFDKGKTPEKFRQQISENLPSPTSSNSLLVESDLPTTMFRLAMQNHHVYTALYDLVPGEIRARKYYETQRLKATNLIKDPDPLPQSVTDLRRIVHEMYDDRAKRRENYIEDPQDEIDAILALYLMDIVGMVVNDDGVEASSQEALHRLYRALIGHPRRSTRMGEWMNDVFVLDRYQELLNRNQQRLSDRWPATRRRWEAIRRRVQATSTTNNDLASRYADRIKEIIEELNDDPSDPSIKARRRRVPHGDQLSDEDDEEEDEEEEEEEDKMDDDDDNNEAFRSQLRFR